MPARRCTDCHENWPHRYEYTRCPRCNKVTAIKPTEDPHYTEDEALHLHEALQKESAAKAKAEAAEAKAEEELAGVFATSDAQQHRVEMYLEYGFTEADANLLACAMWSEVDSQGRTWVRALNHHRVAAALALGCTHDQAVAVFA